MMKVNAHHRHCNAASCFFLFSIIFAILLSGHISPCTGDGGGGDIDRPLDCRVTPCLRAYQCNQITGECVCPPNVDCDNNIQALQIYKITMIFASACLALVMLLFFICLIRRSYCINIDSTLASRANSMNPPDAIINRFNDSQLGMSVPFNIRLPFEKPPTYDESQRRMMQELGIPPPDYPVASLSSRIPPAQMLSCVTVTEATSEIMKASCSSSKQIVPSVTTGDQTSSSSERQNTDRTETSRQEAAAAAASSPAPGVNNSAFDPD